MVICGDNLKSISCKLVYSYLNLNGIAMIKLLDYFYLVNLRYNEGLYKGRRKMIHKIPPRISLCIVANLFSLAFPFLYHIFESLYIIIGFGITGILGSLTIDIIYNKKRREMLRERYKNESHQSRKNGKIVVATYMVLSFVLFFVVLIRVVKP